MIRSRASNRDSHAREFFPNADRIQFVKLSRPSGVCLRATPCIMIFIGVFSFIVGICCDVKPQPRDAKAQPHDGKRFSFRFGFISGHQHQLQRLVVRAELQAPQNQHRSKARSSAQTLPLKLDQSRKRGRSGKGIVNFEPCRFDFRASSRTVNCGLTFQIVK